MLIDTRILHRHGGYEVLAENQAVLFPDNEVIQLHDVRRRGLDDVFLRAWQYEKAHWCVFDLRVIDRKFSIEIPYTLHRDRPGLVLYALRAAFPTAVEFEARCFRNLEATWMALDESPLRHRADFVPAPITFQPELRRHA